MLIGYIILFLSNLSAIPAIWIGRKSKTTLWYYAIACLTADALSFTLKQYHIDHSIVSNLFLLTEFVTVTSYFKYAFIKDRHNVIFAILLGIIGLVFCYNTYRRWLNANVEAQAFNYIDASLFYVAYILLSVGGLYKVMLEMQTVKIEKSPLFLASVGFLVYASGALFPFIYKNIAIETDLKHFAKIWGYFFLPLNIIKNVLIAFSLHCASAGKNR